MHSLLFLSIIISFLSLAVTACAEFQDKPLNPVESALILEKRELSNQAVRGFIEGVLGQEVIWPLKSWNLDSLSLAAIYFHPDMAVMRAQADAMDAANITAAQRPNPTLNATPSYLTHLATAVMPWYAVSSLNIPIETAGKRGFRQDRTAHLTDAMRLRVCDTAWQVRGRLRLAMLEVFAAQENQRLIERQFSLQQAMNLRLEQQFTAGELTRSELIRSQLSLSQTQINISTARKRSSESKTILATAIGLPVEALIGIDIDFSSLWKPPVFATIPLPKLKEIALHQRPDVLAALADYAAAQSALQLEIANQYPNIQANPGYAWETGENLWSLGASIQLPIFHQNQGLIAEAEAKRQEQAIRFQALQMRIIGDIDRAHAGLDAVRPKWLDMEKQNQFQLDNLDVAKAQLKAGDTDPLALLAVELEGVAAERTRLEALVESQQLLNALEDSLRFPLESTLTTEQISASALRNPAP
jgi:outer membrane protein TolC